MAKVAPPQAAASGKAESVANGAMDARLAFGLEINKQFLITIAGGTPTWTTADTLYAALKA